MTAAPAGEPDDRRDPAPGNDPVASVVIPAHDEGAGITATLSTLLGSARPGEFEVLVVCNGCTDDTADRAREFSRVRVEELDQPSKIAALRHADGIASTFPRLYLDGDVGLSTAAARALVTALDDPRPRVAGVVGRHDTTSSTAGARWYFDFRERLPVFRHGVMGAGVYALNRAGRQRLGPWPDVVGDDLWVFLSFADDERITVPGHHTRVEGAPDLRSVFRRQVRVRRGIDDVTTGSARVADATPPAGIPAALRSVAASPRDWPGALTWLAVNAAARLVAPVRPTVGDWQVGRGPS